MWCVDLILGLFCGSVVMGGVISFEVRGLGEIVWWVGINREGMWNWVGCFYYFNVWIDYYLVIGFSWVFGKVIECEEYINILIFLFNWIDYFDYCIVYFSFLLFFLSF